MELELVLNAVLAAQAKQTQQPAKGGAKRVILARLELATFCVLGRHDKPTTPQNPVRSAFSGPLSELFQLVGITELLEHYTDKILLLDGKSFRGLSIQPSCPLNSLALALSPMDQAQPADGLALLLNANNAKVR